jgi:hypothetical protein
MAQKNEEQQFVFFGWWLCDIGVGRFFWSYTGLLALSWASQMNKSQSFDYSDVDQMHEVWVYDAKKSYHISLLEGSVGSRLKKIKKN